MDSITLIKLGGSVITDKSKPYTLKETAIHLFAKDLKKYKKPIIVAHGSGSFGHTSAKKYGGMKGYRSIYGLAKVARDAMEINRLIMDIFIEEKLPAISFRPMSMILTNEGKIINENFKIIEEALKQSFIPVLYGDTIFDKEWKSTIYSGEKTLSAICKYLIDKNYKIEKIIEVGNTNGVVDDTNNTIPIITHENFQKIKKHIQKVEDDVTGGMLHKIQEALNLTEYGISTLLINGKNPGELSKALNNKQISGSKIM